MHVTEICNIDKRLDLKKEPKRKIITIGRVHVPNPFPAIETGTGTEQLYKRAWGDRAVELRDTLSIMLAEFPEISLQLEKPKPLKQKGRFLGMEPYKVVMRVDDSFLGSQEWIHKVICALSANDVTGWHRQMKLYLEALKEAA